MLLLNEMTYMSYADPQSFVRGGPIFSFCLFVFFYEGREDPNIT